MRASRNHLFGKITGGRVRPSVCVNIPPRCESKHEVEGSVLDSGMEPSVQDELCERKEPEPIVLLVIAVEPDVLFKFLVGSFGLAVCLRVI